MASAVVVLESLGALLPDGTQTLIGDELVGSNVARPPCVVFALGQDAFMRPVQGRGPRSIRTLVATVQANIWAVGADKTPRSDMVAVEALRDALVVALERAVPGSYDVVGGQWMASAPNQKGRAYALSFTLDIPVTLPEARATITATQTQQSFGGA